MRRRRIHVRTSISFLKFKFENLQQSSLQLTVSMMDTSSVPEALQDREERSQVDQQIIATPREERLRRRRERERDRRRSETLQNKRRQGLLKDQHSTDTSSC